MRDREDTIAFDMKYCQHYTPETIYGVGGRKATGICGAGVAVKDVRIPKSSHPCIDGHELPNTTDVCPHWIRRTREQGEARADAFAAAIERMTVVMPVVAEWRKKPQATDRKGRGHRMPEVHGSFAPQPSVQQWPRPRAVRDGRLRLVDGIALAHERNCSHASGNEINR